MRCKLFIARSKNRSKMLRLKITYGKEVRHTLVYMQDTKRWSFVELVATVKNLFPILQNTNSWKVTWIDDDQDVITCSSNSEITAAVHVMTHRGHADRACKFNVEVPDSVTQIQEAKREKSEVALELPETSVPPDAPADAPADAPKPTLPSSVEVWTRVWAKELSVLADMGFTDVPALIPLLQERVGLPVSLCPELNGVPHTKGMEDLLWRLRTIRMWTYVETRL